MPNSWSNAALSMWGKTDPPTGQSLSLVRHLQDSAAVAGGLWDSWLSKTIQNHLAEGLPGGLADARSLVVWLAGIHDIGKASPGFAVKAGQIPEFAGLVTEIESQGLTFPSHRRGAAGLPPHGLVGHFLLAEWLAGQHGFTKSVARTFAVVVGGHHGVPPEGIELRSLRTRHAEWVGHRSAGWRAVQDEVLHRMASLTGVTDRLPLWRSLPLSTSQQALLSGIVVVSDWIASNVDLFPYADFSSPGDRATRALAQLNLPRPWSPALPPRDATEHLRSRFPALRGMELTAVQESALQAAWTAEGPPLIVLESPMGSGKTEAALLAAEVLAARFGCGGVFFALPTMATSDALFGRTLSWLRAMPGEDMSVYLAHGKAQLNDDFRGLMHGRISGVNDPHGDEESTAEVNGAGVRVASWLQGRKKGVLANVVVGTIDQVLFGALIARHLVLRHLALAGKVVIVDEVHAADDYMRHYLESVLTWLGRFGAPVILMSATLPPARRDELLAAYAAGSAGRATPVVRSGYPSVVMYDGAVTELELPSRAAAPVELVVENIDRSELVRTVVEAVEEGACVGVVLNTVAAAQSTYAELTEVLAQDKVDLFHSRFLAFERMARERLLRARLGPPGKGTDERPRGYVVVGTQVLEQSLDIDVDLMVTDLAPVDLVLQRAGRLHRHQRGFGERDRAASVRSPRLLLLGVPAIDELPVLDRGSRAVYGSAALLRSAKVLTPHLAGSPIRLPADIPRLVDAAYDDDLLSPDAWEEEWTDAETRRRSLAARQRQDADEFALPSPFRSRDLVGWLRGATSEPEEGTRAQAQVRDSTESLEVVAVVRRGEELEVLPHHPEHGGRTIETSMSSPPPDAVARAILSCALRLPLEFTRPGRIDRVIADLEIQSGKIMSFRESKWLRGVLILVLNPQLEGVVDDTLISYTSRSGLVVGRTQPGEA